MILAVGATLWAIQRDDDSAQDLRALSSLWAQRTALTHEWTAAAHEYAERHAEGDESRLRPELSALVEELRASLNPVHQLLGLWAIGDPAVRQLRDQMAAVVRDDLALLHDRGELAIARSQILPSEGEEVRSTLLQLSREYATALAPEATVQLAAAVELSTRLHNWLDEASPVRLLVATDHASEHWLLDLANQVMRLERFYSEPLAEPVTLRSSTLVPANNRYRVYTSTEQPSWTRVANPQRHRVLPAAPTTFWLSGFGFPRARVALADEHEQRHSQTRFDVLGRAVGGTAHGVVVQQAEGPIQGSSCGAAPDCFRNSDVALVVASLDGRVQTVAEGCARLLAAANHVVAWNRCGWPEERRIHVTDLRDATTRTIEGARMPVDVDTRTPAAFSPDGRYLAVPVLDTGDHAGLGLIDVVSGIARGSNFSFQPGRPAWSNNSQELYFASSSGVLARWRVADPAPVELRLDDTREFDRVLAVLPGTH